MVARTENLAVNVTFNPENELFFPRKELIRRKVADLQRFVSPEGRLLASTIEGQYPADFGRDKLITQILCFEAAITSPFTRHELEPYFPIFRNDLFFLAKTQGVKDDPQTDEKKGKTIHEDRRGPENQPTLQKLEAGDWPVKGEKDNLWLRYWGSVDSTPLFIMAVNLYLKITGDNQLLEEIGPEFEASCQHLLTKENHQTGLVLFEGKKTKGKGGLYHQNWMDSRESNPSPPIYYTEVQGYYYRANQVAAELLGGKNPQLAQDLTERADKLKKTFNQEFFWPEQHYYYAAIQVEGGRLKPVKEVRSSPAHELYCGIIDQEKIQDVASRIMEDDLHGPIGIRTLSSKSPDYLRQDRHRDYYHNGPVWPHDNALIVLGLRKNGRNKDADRIACENLDYHEDLGSPYEYGTDQYGKPALREELSLANTPPTRWQLWGDGSDIYYLASTPSYTPPDQMFDPEKNARFKLPKYHG